VAAGAAAVGRYSADVCAEHTADVALVSRTVLYRYFRDRDDLRLAVAEFIVNDLVATIERHVKVREPRTVRRAIEEPIGAVIEWFDIYPNRHFFIRTQRNLVEPNQFASTFAGRVAETLRKSMASMGIEDSRSLPARPRHRRARRVHVRLVAGCARTFARRTRREGEHLDLVASRPPTARPRVRYRLRRSDPGRGARLALASVLP
jgi:AcrR family transcriptional regulator